MYGSEFGLPGLGIDFSHIGGHAWGVAADYLLSDKDVAIKDKELLKKFEGIQELNGGTKKLVDNF